MDVSEITTRSRPTEHSWRPIIKIITHIVHPDEPSWGLREGPRNGRWVQRVYVVRNDAIAEWSKDYGPVESFKDATEIIYPSFGENSVGQLQEMAERDRHSDWGAKHRQRVAAESTLISDILRDEERGIHVRANRSTLGPAISVQRNDFPREAVKEKRNAARKSRKG